MSGRRAPLEDEQGFGHDVPAYAARGHLPCPGAGLVACSFVESE
jgi:hypothetical protein